MLCRRATGTLSPRFGRQRGRIPVAAALRSPPKSGHSCAMLVRCPGKFGKGEHVAMTVHRGSRDARGCEASGPASSLSADPRARPRSSSRRTAALPLLARSPADERERPRTGTAPAAPGVGAQAPARASRPTQPADDRRSRRGRPRWHCRGHQRCRVPRAARARMPPGNDLPRSDGTAVGLRVARSRRPASARCRAEPAAGALSCRGVPSHGHRHRRAVVALHAAAGHSSTRHRPPGRPRATDEKEPHPTE